MQTWKEVIGKCLYNLGIKGGFVSIIQNSNARNRKMD